jgi:hypothetical protein
MKKGLIAISILAGLIFLLAYPTVYVVRGGLAGGVLYWDSDEALLFMSEGSAGAKLGYLRYSLEPLLVGMAGVRQPNDERCSKIFVIRVTDKDVRVFDTDLNRYAKEPYCGFAYELFAGSVYAGYLATDEMWKWSGEGFEPTTPDEVRAFHVARAAATPNLHPWEFNNVGGWSMRALGQTTPRYDLTLNGEPVTILFHGETWPPAPVSMDLIRSGHESQTIWSFDGRPHRVTKAEYERLFAIAGTNKVN